MQLHIHSYIDHIHPHVYGAYSRGTRSHSCERHEMCTMHSNMHALWENIHYIEIEMVFLC